jgi:esterase/lipase superfamily enzyme
MRRVLFLAILAALVLAPATARAACGRAAGGPTIFYATDREPAADTQLFTGERGIGPGRKPIVSYGMLSAPVDATTRQACASSTEFEAALGHAFEAASPQRVLIYIHGYYTTFRAAAADAIAIERGLLFSGPVIAYSWPSKVTSRLAYLKDETNASWSLVHFRALLTSIRRAYPNAQISFASHSLGSRFGAAGIAHLHATGCTACLGRSVFFAPDIDAETLHSELSHAGFCDARPAEKPVASAPITLYVSNKDLALRQSQHVHGHQRAGQAGNELILCSGVDTIDVSRFKSSDKAGHGYFLDAGVDADFRAAFAGTSPASKQRNLKRVSRPGGTYYELNP